MEIFWLPHAITTREAQVNYVADINPQAAIDMDERIEQQVDQLAAHPDMGRAGRRRGTRELVISRTPLIVVYRVKARVGRVEILRVLHGAQQWPPL